MPPKASKTATLASRIKRVMQRDEDVGKIASQAPIVLARALELFVKQLTSTVADVAALHGAKTITASHLKGAIATVPQQFDFLSDLVEDAADLPPPPDLATLEAELRAREAGGGETKKTAKSRGKKSKGATGDLGMGDLGDLGDLGGDAKPKAKPRARAAKPRRKAKKEDDFIDDEEEFVEEMSETDEEFDPEEVVPPRQTSGRSRRGASRKTYREYDEDDIDEASDEDVAPAKKGRVKREIKEEPEAPMASLGDFGSLGGDPFAAGSLGGAVGGDESDYD